MNQSDYNNLKQQHSELTATEKLLEDQIYACKDEKALVLLRADYRELIQKKESIYEQLISVKS